MRNKLKTLLQMAIVLTYAASRAGREDRPDRRAVRQAALQAHRDPRRRELPAYRGDSVNGFDFTAESRAPRPEPAAAAPTTPPRRR